MNRKAILLAASPEDDPIPGVYQDLKAFYAYLRSNPGGAWDDGEIFVEENTTRNQVIAAINAAQNADYSLVYFAGHGESVRLGLPWLETRMLLRSGETITERELNSRSPRCTLIMDCCRRTPEQNIEASLINFSMLLEHGRGSIDFRKFYQKGLEVAESGLVKIYSTAAGSAAADIHSFTQYLLNETNKWVVGNKGILSLEDAVNLAKIAMKLENPQQQPEYQGGRRLRHFPFAVQI